jgi:competence protein ComEC
MLARGGADESHAALALVLGAGTLVAARLGRAPPWAAAMLLAAYLRPATVPAEPRSPRVAATEVARLRDGALAGRWHGARERGRGWLEPLGHDRAAPPLLHELEGPAPEDGTPVAILPGGPVMPWPRGPVPASASRARDFEGLSSVGVDELVLLEPAPRSPCSDAIRSLRRLDDRLFTRLAGLEGPSSSGLLCALALGTTEGMPPERIDLFARTSTTHLLAISGWHVGLFAALLLFPLACLEPRRRSSSLVLLGLGLVLLLFTGVAGGGKPVVRASIAFLLVLAARRRRTASGAAPRRADGLSCLAAAFTLECLLDPAGIESLSLQLSYAATLGLLLGTGALTRALGRSRVDEGPVLAPRARLLSGLRRRLGRLAAGALAASGAAVLATLPATWSTFGEVAPAGIVLTPLCIGPIAALSIVAWAGMVVPWPGLTTSAEVAARALYGILVLGDSLPGTPVVLPARPFAALVLAVALAFLSLRRRAARRPACLLAGVLLLPWSAAPAGLELHALDVGHGTALVMRAPGLEALVLDAGSRDRRGLAREALVPLLARWDVARPTVVVTHADRDHAGALERIATRWPGASWWGADPAQWFVRPPHAIRADLGPGWLAWEAPCPELGLRLVRGSEAAGNEGSRALEVRWRSERLLLCGDAEESMEAFSLRRGPLRLLLAPHHGSDVPGLGSFLGRSPPEEVWISATAPPAVAPELDRRRIPWRWTARDGPLALTLP